MDILITINKNKNKIQKTIDKNKHTIRKAKRISLFIIKIAAAFTFIAVTITLAVTLSLKHVEEQTSAQEASTELPQGTTVTVVDDSIHEGE